ncbi:MAG TPA: hypothetical protein ENF50_01035 [Archaeoglobus veneficus]|nr:hypothetical protein [Archaeoglobus veneficus]
MEDAKRLREMALKIGRYRCIIVSSLSWVIFGMLFALATLICISLQLFGSIFNFTPCTSQLLGIFTWFRGYCFFVCFLYSFSKAQESFYA